MQARVHQCKYLFQYGVIDDDRGDLTAFGSKATHAWRTFVSGQSQLRLYKIQSSMARIRRAYMQERTVTNTH